MGTIRRLVRRAAGAECSRCGLTSDSCVPTEYFDAAGNRFRSVPVGTAEERYEERVRACFAALDLTTEDFWLRPRKCGTCHAPPGGFHHAECSREECPVCGQLGFTCHCVDAANRPNDWCDLHQLADALGWISSAARTGDVTGHVLLNHLPRILQRRFPPDRDELRPTPRLLRRSDEGGEPTPEPPPSPARAREALARGSERESAGDYRAALGDYEIAVKNDAELVDAWVALGRCNHKALFSERGLSCFARAVELEPSRADAWAGKAMTLNALRRPQDALEASDIALGHDSRCAGAWYERGVSLRSLERLPDAVIAFERAIELEPSNMAAWKLRGLSQQGTRRIRFEMGLIMPLSIIGPVTAHVDTADEVAESSGVPLVAATLLVDGARLAESGEVEEAIRRFADATDLAPSFARAWSYRARCLQFSRRFDEAAACYEKASDLKGGDAEDLEGLGSCQLALGNVDEALVTYGDALRRAPHFAAACYGRSAALEEAGRKEEALAAYDQFLALAGADDSFVVAVAFSANRFEG